MGVHVLRRRPTLGPIWDEKHEGTCFELQKTRGHVLRTAKNTRARASSCEKHEGTFHLGPQIDPKSLKIERNSEKMQRIFGLQFFNDFSWFFSQKWVPKLVIFGTFFENVDFAKNSVSPRRKPLFSDSEP